MTVDAMVTAASPKEPSETLRGADLLREVGLYRILKEDWNHHYRQIAAPGFWALAVYRWGVWSETLPIRPLRWLGLLIYVISQRFVRNFFGIELERTVAVGRRLRLAHQHGIVVHRYAKFGDDVMIRHGVTMGRGTEWIHGVGPEIGSRVEFSPGVVIIGNVRIGDDVSVGPNCVISQDVPSGRNLFVTPPRSFPKSTNEAE